MICNPAINALADFPLHLKAGTLKIANDSIAVFLSNCTIG